MILPQKREGFLSGRLKVDRKSGDHHFLSRRKGKVSYNRRQFEAGKGAGGLHGIWPQREALQLTFSRML
jgi:hypothetical protein